MNFEIEVHGSVEIVARLEALPEKLRASLRKKVPFLALLLEDHIKSDKLSGQVLNVVTGRLRRSIHSDVIETGTSIEGRVSSSGDVKYAAIHEYGFSGAETVRAHTREIKQAFGHAITPRTVNVREFVRQMEMPERSFMRSSFDDLKDVLRRGLVSAINEGLAE